MRPILVVLLTTTKTSFSFFMSQDSLIVKLTISQTRSSLALGQISDPPTV